MTALQGTSNIVVAEAAATKDEISVLRSLGSQYAQGDGG
jgi:EAL domain-containing protein (putative c-di-GMP-specific phosphodiesterase class I)